MCMIYTFIWCSTLSLAISERPHYVCLFKVVNITGLHSLFIPYLGRCGYLQNAISTTCHFEYVFVFFKIRFSSTGPITRKYIHVHLFSASYSRIHLPKGSRQFFNISSRVSRIFYCSSKPHTISLKVLCSVDRLEKPLFRRIYVFYRVYFIA